MICPTNNTMLAVLVVLLAVAGFSQGDLADEYQNNIKLHDSYTLYWTHNNSQSAMNFAVKAKTLGWVAFGFANKIDNMKGYDVAVGYISSGVNIELRDFHTVGHQAPVIDSKENLDDKSGSEDSDFTTLKFKRQLNTGDQNDDIVIKPGKMIVVWSYGNVDDVTKKHILKGYKTITLIPGAASTAHVTSWMLLLSTSAFGLMMSYGVSF